VNEVDIMKWALGTLAAIVGWLWVRNETRWDKQGDLNASLEKTLNERMTALELKVAGDVASKEDVDKVQRRLDDMAHELGLIGKTMARVEERLRIVQE
jgi:hypothetical protein